MRREEFPCFVFFFSFQYILNAPTSIATKKGEPSLTYINQGQSYELKLKKLGDLSNHYKKKWLHTSIRICFHERRLQYIESEQIAEWSRTHPNERILEVRSLSHSIHLHKSGKWSMGRNTKSDQNSCEPSVLKLVSFFSIVKIFFPVSLPSKHYLNYY